MTQKQFDELPLVLTPAQASEATGLKEDGLAALRSTNPTLATVLPGMKHWRYHKAVLAKILKLQYK